MPLPCAGLPVQGITTKKPLQPVKGSAVFSFTMTSVSQVCIRHRVTTDIAASGVPSKVDMKLTGHKTVAMFMHYVHAEDIPVWDVARQAASRRFVITGAFRSIDATA